MTEYNLPIKEWMIICRVHKRRPSNNLSTRRYNNHENSSYLGTIETAETNYIKLPNMSIIIKVIESKPPSSILRSCQKELCRSIVWRSEWPFSRSGIKHLRKKIYLELMMGSLTNYTYLLQIEFILSSSLDHEINTALVEDENCNAEYVLIRVNHHYCQKYKTKNMYKKMNCTVFASLYCLVLLMYDCSFQNWDLF